MKPDEVYEGRIKAMLRQVRQDWGARDAVDVADILPLVKEAVAEAEDAPPPVKTEYLYIVHPVNLEAGPGAIAGFFARQHTEGWEYVTNWMQRVGRSSIVMPGQKMPESVVALMVMFRKATTAEEIAALEAKQREVSPEQLVPMMGNAGSC